MINLPVIKNNWEKNNWSNKNVSPQNIWKARKASQFSSFYESQESLYQDLESEVYNLANDLDTLKGSLLGNYFLALDEFIRLVEQEGLKTTEDIIFEQLSLELLELITIKKVPVGEYIELTYNIFKSIQDEKRKFNILEIRTTFANKIKEVIGDLGLYYKIDIKKHVEEISQLRSLNSTLSLIKKRQELLDLRNELRLITDNLPESDFIFIMILLSWLESSDEYVLGQFYEWEEDFLGEALIVVQRQLTTLRATKFVKKGFISRKPSNRVTAAVFSNNFFALSLQLNKFGEPGLSSEELKKVFSIEVREHGFFDEKYKR